MLEADTFLKDRIKLIGIGAGNSAYEVATFAKTYHIRFPLFEDGDFNIHKKIGEVRTPYFIGVRKGPEGSATVFFSKLGGFKNPETFLQKILDAAGIRKGRSP